MAMDYFRRPQLAGKNLVRTTHATIRGNVRRSDADGTSAVPYFPNVSAGQTLNVKVQATTYVVTLTGNDLLTILNDINAALTTNGQAFDADGCIGIRTNTQGGAGLVAITGGNAADGLGFDLVSNESVGALGGEVYSSPESRISNWYGTAFPSLGEDLTAETVSRGMGRLASNIDVLHSELVREDAVVQKIQDVNAVNEIKNLAVDVNAKVFTGLGLLSATSNKHALGRFFFLLDTVTGAPAASRVTAVVKGTPGTYPRPGGGYANTANWAAADGGNVLGQNLTKVSSQAITVIREGRVVEVPTADFSAAGVKEGDPVEISGATNLNPFSHNGHWIIEDVRSSTALALRPMSAAEMDLHGFTPTGIQPVLELNEKKQGVEVFGNLTVRTGTFMNGLTLVVEPPIPAGAAYELWAASPTSFRSDGFLNPRQSLLENSQASSRTLLTTDHDLVPTTILSGFEVSVSGFNLNVAAGYVRWRGRVIHVPARTWLNNGTQIPNGTSFLYFNEAEGCVKVGNAAAWSSLFNASSSNRGLLLAKLVATTGVSLTITSARRLAGEKARDLTVGTGGQFETLTEALAYINEWAAATSEIGISNGDYAHWDLVILNNQTVTGTLPVKATVKIRGANPLLNIVMNGATFSLDVGGTLILQDIRIDRPATTNEPLVTVTAAGGRVICSGVTHVGGAFAQLVKSTGSGSLDSILVRDSDFTFSKGVLHTAIPGDGTGFIFLNSTFRYVTDGSGTPVLFAPAAGTGAWGGEIHVDGCKFLDWTTTLANANPLFANLASADITASVITDSYFKQGAFPANSDNVLIRATSRLFFKNNIVELVPLAIAFDGTAEVVVSENRIAVKPNASGSTAVACLRARNNHVAVSAPDTVGNNGIALQAAIATGNVISGRPRVAVQTLGGAGNVAANNQINMNPATAITAVGIGISGTNGSVTGNTVILTDGAANSCCIQASSATAVSITGNSLSVAMDCNAITSLGSSGVFSGNYVANGATVSLGSGPWQISANRIGEGGVDLSGAGADYQFIGNWIVGGVNLSSNLGDIFFNENYCLGDVIAVGANTGTTQFVGNNIFGNTEISPLLKLVCSGNYLSFLQVGNDSTVTANNIGGLAIESVTSTCNVSGNWVLGDLVISSDGAGSSITIENNSLDQIDTSSLTGLGRVFIKNNRIRAATPQSMSNLAGFEGNHTSVAVTIAGLASGTLVSGNRFEGAVTLTFTDCSVIGNEAPSGSFLLNRCLANSNILGGNIDAAHSTINSNQCNNIQARSDISPATNVLVINGNRVGNSIVVSNASSVQQAVLTGNHCSVGMVLSKPSVVTGNYVASTMTMNAPGYLANNYLVWFSGANSSATELVLTGNYVGYFTTLNISATKVWAVGNTFALSSRVEFTPGLGTAATEVYVKDNYHLGLGTNGFRLSAHKIDCIGNTTSRIEIVTPNTGGGASTIRIAKNLLSNNNATAIQVVDVAANEVLIEDNSLTVNTITGGAGAATDPTTAILVDPEDITKLIKITGNTIRGTVSGTLAAISSSKEAFMVLIETNAGGGNPNNTQRIVVADNVIEKPVLQINGGNEWSWTTLKINPAQAAGKGTMLDGNYITRNGDGSMGVSASTFGGVSFANIYKGANAYAAGTSLWLTGD